MKTGAELIAEERQRQVEKEGWTAERDDHQHECSELAIAAACYAVAPHKMGLIVPRFCNCRSDGECFHNGPIGYDFVSGKWGDAWPWHKDWDKREAHTPVRRLVIAGALIAAEIDRLLRVSGDKEGDKGED